jgi:hypothetical protein
MVLNWFQTLRSLFCKNPLYYIYIAVLALICNGVFVATGTKYLPLIGLFFGVFTLTYFGFKRFDNIFFIQDIKKIIAKLLNVNTRVSNYLIWTLFSFTIFFIIFHLYFLGHVPALKAYLTLDYYGIAFIRQAINEHDNGLIKYLSAFVFKGLLPFLLLFFYIKKRKWFYVLLAFGVFYAIALMQKSFIVTILFPLIIYMALTKKYLQTVSFFLLFVGGVYCLVYITNPILRATEKEIELELSQLDKDYYEKVYKGSTASIGKNKNILESFTNASGGILERVFYTTGMVSTYWFENIPSKYPHSGWCGYNFLNPYTDCEYEDYDYSRIIYDEVYGTYAAKGLKGTVTVASFVYDYATFGYLGVAISGAILALFFLLIQNVFGGDYRWIICLNFLSVFWLSSAALSTLMLSGGWILIIGLYLIFENDLKKSFN